MKTIDLARSFVHLAPDGSAEVLISGAVRVSIDHDDRDAEMVALRQGAAFVVPKGVWHRVLVDEPCDLLHLTPGRSETR